MNFNIYISVLFILLSSSVFSQGATCNIAEPACAGGGFIFENVSNGTVGEDGPDYGCMGVVPNPSWFYFNVAASGDISFSIEQNTQADFNGTGLDVDFICYGPFTTTDDYCTMLTAENTSGCSFEPDFIENFSITNAIAGEVYILLMTNYAGTAGFIKLAQEASTGSTDCSILTDSVVLCETESYTIDLTLSNPGTSYSWTYDNGSGPVVISGETSPILNLPIDLDGDSILDPFSGDYTATVVSIDGTNTVINAITYNSVPSAFNVDNLRLCDDDDLLDTFKEFDFTNQITDVSGGQTDVIVNFYLNLESAENNIDALDLAPNNLYTNTSNPQEIFIRIENSQNPNCFETTSFIISTDVPLIANEPTIDEISLCDIGNDNSEVFDLVNQFQSEIIGSQSDLNVNYYDANNSLIINPNAYNVTLPEETITIEIEYIDTDNVCSSVSTSIKMILDSQPIIEGVATLEQCDTDSNGIVAFNLNEANQILSTNFVNENFVYYNSLSDAQLGDVSNAIINTEAFLSSTGISVFATVTNDKGCVNYGEVVLFVGTSSIPVSTSYPFSECDDNYDGIITFDFSDAESEIFSIFPTSVNILISYYENEEDALSELNAIPDISNHQNSNSLNSQSIWVRVDSQDLNGCLGLGEHIFLTVDPLPNEIVIDDVYSCSDGEIGNFDLSNATLQAQNGDTNIIITYHETQEQADLGLGPLNAPYLFDTRTLFVRAENNTTSCYTSSMTVNLIVNPNPILSTPETIQTCDDITEDGLANFNLFENIDEIIDDSADFSVTFYTNQSEAILGSEISLISDPYNYSNTTNPQNVYIRVENTLTNCSTIETLELEVVSPPEGYSLSEPLSYCDTDTDGIGYFDLNSVVSEISGGLAPETVTVEFFETLINAELGIDVIETDVLYENLNSDYEVQTLYAKLSIGDLECSTIITVDLLVLLSPEFEFTPDELTYRQCADVDNTSGILIYDLIYFARNEQELNIDLSFDINFYENLNEFGTPLNLITNPSTYANTSQGQVIYMSIADASVTDSNGDVCSLIVPITLQVDNLPAATDYLYYELCDNEYYEAMNDLQNFDLPSQLPNMIASTVGVNVSYFEYMDLTTGVVSSQIPDSDLTSYENRLNNPQDVFVEFTNELGCSVVKVLKLTVLPNPTPLKNIDIVNTLGNEGVLEVCDGDIDGSGDISEQKAVFDITQWETSIIDLETGVSVSYYESYDAALSGTSPIINATSYTNLTNPQTIYVSVLSDGTGVSGANGTGCATIVQFDIYVPVPSVTISSSKPVICMDSNGMPLTGTDLPVLTAIAGDGSSLSSYEYQWLLNGVIIPGAIGETYTVTAPGSYSVTVSGPTDFTCVNSSLTLEITTSGSPDSYTASVTTQAFADAHQVVATASSINTGVVFLYSLDDGEATDNGVFDDVSPGSHTVTITDGQGCWSYTEEVIIVDYPRFFTPNGDGVNDTWSIIEQQEIPISQIYIFDRFGKLLKQLEPDGTGWDGLYNGTQMPATDYWFKIIYIEGADSAQKEFRANFSLKR